MPAETNPSTDLSGKEAQIVNPSHLLFGATGKLLRNFNTERTTIGRTYRFICTGAEGMKHAPRGKETIVAATDVVAL